MEYDWVIRNATILDGCASQQYKSDVGIFGDRIARIGDLSKDSAKQSIDAKYLCLAPGFIDVHTHDDIQLLTNPEMVSKISQGVTTVIVGNCGISASPVRLKGSPPDPMNLLGREEDFVFPTVAAYSKAIDNVRPAVNAAALVGHTSLRNNHMLDLNRPATFDEIALMRQQLAEGLTDGAIGLSSGLAYGSAINAPPEEVESLAEELALYDGIYTTHLRSEFEGVVDALEEAFALGRHANVPVVISHFKCAGVSNWGRTKETIPLLSEAARKQEIACDCYPYSASSSILDLLQVSVDCDIFITWSESCPEQACKMLADIALAWDVPIQVAAKRLQPAGAVYHNMHETDVQRVLKYSDCMIGSDGLPNDPHPHPRLWGTFPRVLGHYCRDLKIFDLPEAVRRMTGLPAAKFRLKQRGVIAEGNFADLVLFDASKVIDMASFDNPIEVAQGIDSVWVNGALSYKYANPIQNRAGRFLARQN